MSTLFFVFTCFCVAGALCDKSEKQLYKDLLSDYQPLERPIINSSVPITVRLGMILQQLISVDEKNQIINANAWLKYSSDLQTWSDYNLRWNPVKYAGISRIVFPLKTIWMPDVLLYNSVDSNFDSTFPANMAAYNDGTVNWNPPAIFKISCKMDITYFPFDEQQCYFKFGAWSYDGTLVDVQPDEMDMSEYLPNGEWIITNTSVVRSVLFYDCCPEPYPDVRFYITMRRRTLYYYFNLVLPCTLITAMCIVGFTLPPAAGEKTTLQMTVMLAIGFFLKVVTDMTPRTSEALPLLGVFFSSCLILVSASILLTVLVLNMHHSSPESCQMGRMTRILMLYWIPWLVRMKRPGYKFKLKSLPSLSAEKRKASSVSKMSLMIGSPKKSKASINTRYQQNDESQEKKLDDNLWHFRKISKIQKDHADDLIHSSELMQITQRILAELRSITKRVTHSDAIRVAENDWKFAASVADRLCLILLTLAIVLSTTLILSQAPYLYA